MKMFPIKSTSVKFVSRIILLASVLIFSGFAANAQTIETTQTQPSVQSSQPQAQPKTADQTESPRPTVILVPDISLSVRKSNKKMQSVMQQIIYAAPENSIIGIVTVGTQSEKRVFLNREEAISYLTNINANSPYTDLERGTDATLAVIQETKATKPTLVVYLTDGEVSLPKELKNKMDFKAILNREFSIRPEIKVLVLNVASNPMDTAGLPSNVLVVPLSNWEEAEKEMKQTLAAQIQNDLKTEPISNPTTENETVSVETNNSRPTALLWAIPILLVVIMGACWFLIRRRKGKAETTEEIAESEPLNLLRPEDLLLQNGRNSSGLVALVEFYDGKIARSEQLLTDERCVIGKATTADIKFSSLKQENSLEIRFDGKQVTAFRLHPQKNYEMDEVCLNQVRTSPSQTTFHLRNSDTLLVGNVQITVKIVESTVAEILNENNRFATNSFRSNSQNKPTISSTRALNERKSRWN